VVGAADPGAMDEEDAGEGDALQEPVSRAKALKYKTVANKYKKYSTREGDRAMV
jgi:hypothetical protein